MKIPKIYINKVVVVVYSFCCWAAEAGWFDIDGCAVVF